MNRKLYLAHDQEIEVVDIDAKYRMTLISTENPLVLVLDPDTRLITLIIYVLSNYIVHLQN